MRDDGMQCEDGDRWDLVPASMLAAYAYCPRQCYLQWVEGESADSAEMADGRLKHREVDTPSGEIPMDGSGPFQATSVFMTAPLVGISCCMDLLEGDGGRVTPVEYKRGEVPNIPEGAYESVRVQLCAEGLALQENGFDCHEGAVYYVRSSRRIPVAFDDSLVKRTMDLLSELREVARKGDVPPPLIDSQRCNCCSYAGICLPDEVNLLKAMEAESEGSSPEGAGIGIRELYPRMDEGLPIYVVGQGNIVRKHGDRLEVWSKGEKVTDAKLIEVSQVSLYGGVEITTPATIELMQRGIPVLHFTHGGWFQGMYLGTTQKNVELRKKQFEWACDPGRALSIARGIVSGKIKNCRALVRRNDEAIGPETLESLNRLSSEAQMARSLDELRGLEGWAARIYFSAFGRMLKPEGAEFSFEHRNKRPPRDPVNAIISYLYGILVKELFVTLLATGFDPYMGFYHQPRFGRPSLALDMMEEFRPAIADPVALMLFNNNEMKEGDFTRTGIGITIAPQAKRKVLAGYEHRMSTEVRHPLFGYKVSYRRVVEMQSRLLSRVVSGEIAEYPAFIRR